MRREENRYGQPSFGVTITSVLAFILAGYAAWAIVIVALNAFLRWGWL